MLTGKTALITGSTSGIGLGMAQAFARRGANVVINGLATEAQIDEAVKAVKDAGAPDVLFHGANMMNADEIADMVNQANDRFGGVDILCNNAGIQHTSPTEDFPEEKWDAIIAINLTSLFHTTRLCLPHMQKQNWGRIINTASVHGLVASVNKVAYVAAKHGVVGMTKVVALETAETGITCNAIAPGWVDTPLIQKQIQAKVDAGGGTLEEGTRDLLMEKQPSLQFVSTEQLGETAAFLASDAAAQITGVTLPVDGGWTAR